MFNQNVEKETYPSQSPSPELQNLNELFVKANAEYLDILYSVEDKLHNILNLRSPEKGVEPQSDKSINDFAASMHSNLMTLRNQNTRLQKVLEHLKKII